MIPTQVHDRLEWLESIGLWDRWSDPLAIKSDFWESFWICPECEGISGNPYNGCPDCDPDHIRYTISRE